MNFKKIANHSVFKVVLDSVQIGSLFLASAHALAMAPAPPSPSNPPGSQAPVNNPSCPLNPNPTNGLVAANPIRKVLVRPIETQVFRLPNGNPADTSIAMKPILSTIISNSQKLIPMDSGELNDPNACLRHAEIRAAISSFELNLYELNLQFGYTPLGESPITGVNGKAKVKLSKLTMQMGLWDCDEANHCGEVVSVTASNFSAGVNVDAEIDFGEIKTGPELLMQPSIDWAVRAIMNDGIRQIVASPRLSSLPWQARVRDYYEANNVGTLIFDQGVLNGIGLNQGFEIYATSGAGNACDVYRVVGYARTTRVDSVSSVAVMDKVLDSRGVQVGDVVRIRPIGQ